MIHDMTGGERRKKKAVVAWQLSPWAFLSDWSYSGLAGQSSCPLLWAFYVSPCILLLS